MSKLRCALAAVIVVVLLAITTSATAQPGNDRYPGRTLIPADGLRFVDAVDTTTATSDATDAELNAQCGAPATDASVWYELTPAVDGTVDVDVSQSVGFAAGVIVAIGQPDAFLVVTCGPGAVQFEARTGEAYTILAFDDRTSGTGGTGGGELRIRVSLDTSANEVLERIRGLPGVREATPGFSSIPGASFFQILFEQPVDHDHPDRGTFLQRITLLHRADSGPTVFALDGYTTIFDFSVQEELTYLLQANQIKVEHRFFPPSSPAVRSWEHLTIEQSAADHHRVVAAFKQLYGGSWVSTGRSKGGMAAVYHRFFYPADVDATVAYVTPSSHGTRDARYVEFVDRLGTPQCRARLRTFQETALARRAELLPVLPPYGFDILGADRAFEFAVVETPAAFWQFGRFNSCDAIPAADATPEDLVQFLDSVFGLFSVADGGLNFLAPYYYQAATELGAPRYDERGLRLHYPREDTPAVYPPLDVDKDFNRQRMQQIESWVNTSGRRMLFVYGQGDPWSAGAFDVQSMNDSYRLFVSGAAGDHLAALLDLTEEDRAFALSKLSEWLGGSPSETVRRGAERSTQPIHQPTRHELFLR